MPVNPRLLQHLQRTLLVTTDSGSRGSRHVEDAQRLWARVQRLVGLKLIPQDADLDALELACYALQLPLRQGKGLPVGRLGQISLRERAEQAAELSISSLETHAAEDLLERTARLLREMPSRSPAAPEARLLADALNLDDFGLTGMLLQAACLSRQGEGLFPFAEGYQKRRQYGYWEARLKDSFHFEPVRQMARQRLAHAEQAANWLMDELNEDQPKEPSP